jgi:adenylate cyclase
MTKYATPQDEWRAYLDGTHYTVVWGRRLFRHIPWSPRCFVCYAPFRGPGGWTFRRFGIRPWEKNPNVCTDCIRTLRKSDVMGADAEISFLFADVRDSSELARKMGSYEFAFLMQRFYRTATDILFGHGAILDKFVGDAVVGFFMPFMTGPDHQRVALEAARDLLVATGHEDEDGPWLPLGAAVNAGTCFVGMVSRGTGGEFTAFGDPINLAAHLSNEAGVGEILTTPETSEAAGMTGVHLERRHLALKGRQVDAVVVPLASIQSG